ncbi:UNVERIFIED_CONTAM: hypothetical protein Slati_0942000 [Sesamum latifolium]|uniref:Transposase MuDR plant domain-containing protein n=1 Tax=Sesamum latifolium TaxID=2727402 RepID=A0AAW2XPE5_9LAMI
MSMLIEDAYNLLAITQAMDMVGINEDYAGPSSFHQQNNEYFELEADSFLNNDLVDSEPDEVEVEGQIDGNPENNDEVSIPVMLDVLGSNGNESTSHVQEAIDLNMPATSEPPSLYLVVPFLVQYIQSGGHFYDSNFGKLACGMIFKSKDHLKENVQDFLMRFARWEYRVVESKSKSWKVTCKESCGDWVKLDAMRDFQVQHGII